VLEPLFECVFDEVYTYVKQSLSSKMDVLECNVITQVCASTSPYSVSTGQLTRKPCLDSIHFPSPSLDDVDLKFHLNFFNVVNFI